MGAKKPERILKRAFDIVLASFGIVLAAPVFLFTAYKIYSEMGSPVFYDSKRAGTNGLPFKVYKFRTMTDAKDSSGNLLADEARITKTGKRIRELSLDELPQLFNVLKGDMSIVGPRPLLLDYVPLYDESQKKRLSVPQGITGWAQINGRNATTWEKRFAYDTWYVDNWSFSLDLKIIMMTIVKVIKREGISAEGEATMPRFLGNAGKK